jgi:hypothetical protein
MEEPIMRKVTLGLFALVLAGTFTAANGANAQGGTTPQSQSMGASRSGSAIDSDQGKGGIPTDVTKSQFDEGFTGQAPGIGEKGSGQGQSTMERSAEKPGQGTQSSDSSQRKNSQEKEKHPHDKRDR